MTSAPSMVLALVGAVACGFAGYLLLLAVASVGARATTRLPASRRRLVVLIPAHNEEDLVGRCVTSLLEQTHPRDLYRVVVIADNGTDRTPSVAAEAGAEVLIRDEPGSRGKGRALRWAIDRILERRDEPDAIVVVDADSVADRDLLSGLAAELDRGHLVVQADYRVLLDDQASRRTRLVAAAFLLFHRVRFGGRARLGMSANLVGNGMLFATRVLREHPWTAFSGVEDLEHSIDLRLAGIRIQFAPAAIVSGPSPASRAGEFSQRLRWEGGRFNVVRTRLVELVRTGLNRRDLGLMDAALDLATPPLGLLSLITGAGTAVVASTAVIGLVPRWTMVPWLAAVIGIAAFVVVGLWSARAPLNVWTAIASAPVYLAWKVLTYVSLSRGFDPRRWDRSDRRKVDPSRVTLAGVPVDPVDLATATERVRCAIGGRRPFHIATINLDFLVRAQKDADVMRIFHTTDLNLADGSPVVWLAKLLGRRLPGRVAGADLVPALAGELSLVGASFFLLGGEEGSAAAAAARMQQLFPALEIAGTYEPPRSAISAMNNDDILARIAESRADVLLVAFGHPKQELWIDAHRDLLHVSVVIGVGCVFDLLAGKSRRAPAWMQAVGLEWLYRLQQEPRRLAGRYLTDAAWLVPVTARVLRARLAS